MSEKQLSEHAAARELLAEGNESVTLETATQEAADE